MHTILKTLRKDTVCGSSKRQDEDLVNAEIYKLKGEINFNGSTCHSIISAEIIDETDTALNEESKIESETASSSLSSTLKRKHSAFFDSDFSEDIKQEHSTYPNEI